MSGIDQTEGCSMKRVDPNYQWIRRLLKISSLVVMFVFGGESLLTCLPQSTGTISFVNAAPIARLRADSPQIRKITPAFARLQGGDQVVIKGENFTPDTVVVVGDAVASNVQVIQGKKIKFTVPPQKAPGMRTLSVWTLRGITQIPFQIFPKKLGELADGEITTIAGGVEYVKDGKDAGDAYFSLPTYVTRDNEGNLYISDTFHHRIRRIDAETNLVTTIVGNGRRGFDGDEGMSLAASIAFPGKIVITQDSKLVFIDAGNARIRQADLQTGLITTVAGNGSKGFGGDGGPAINAKLSLANSEFSAIGGIAIDQIGNLYIADLNNSRIRRVEKTTGIITTYAGTGQSTTNLGDGGPATQANISYTLDVAIDPAGNLLITDTGNNRIRRVDGQSGIISTIAGNGQNGFAGDGMPATQARISAGGVEVDSKGNIYISDGGNYRIRRIDAETTIIQTVVGNGTQGKETDMGEVLATETGLGILYGGGIFLTPQSELLIAEGQWDRIRSVNLQTGIMTTRAGGKPPENGDTGPALKARLNFFDIVNQLGVSKPGDIAVDRSGDMILLAEAARHRIRKIDMKTGVITTIAGTGEPGYNGDGQMAGSSMLSEPTDVVFDPVGNVVIADFGNNRIRQIRNQTGFITTIAGNGSNKLNAAYDDENDSFDFFDDFGPAIDASLGFPLSVAFDTSGRLFLTHYSNFIRQVDPQTQIITSRIKCCRGLSPSFRGMIVGKTGTLYLSSLDGLLKLEPNSSELKGVFDLNSYLFDVAVNQKEFLFIPIMARNSLYKTDQNGKSNILIAGGEPGYSGDNGPATEAAFLSPSAVAIDGANNLYIVDSGNHAVRVIKNGAR